MRPAARLVLLVLVAAVLLPALASACPLCKDAKADTDYAGGTASLPHGFYYSILLMVSVPFLVVGGLALRITLAHRRRALLPAPQATDSAAPMPAPRLLADTPGARP